jgi:hypothetical protein
LCAIILNLSIDKRIFTEVLTQYSFLLISSHSDRMKTESSSPDNRDKQSLPENQAPNLALLATLAEALETDENIEKLAKKLADEWNSTTDGKIPDLPFSRFLDKLEKTKNQ